MSADSLEALWNALTTRNTQQLVEGLRSAPSLSDVAAPCAPRMRVVIVKNDLDECHYCGAEDRNGDFKVQTINGVQVAACDVCECLMR